MLIFHKTVTFPVTKYRFLRLIDEPASRLGQVTNERLCFVQLVCRRPDFAAPAFFFVSKSGAYSYKKQSFSKLTNKKA